MAKDSPPPSNRIGALSRSLRARSGNSQLLPGVAGIRRDAINSLAIPSAGLGVMMGVAFALLCSLVMLWARGQSYVAVGRVMDDTRLVRVPLEINDDTRTLQLREQARQNTPRVYVADAPAIDGIISSLENLPVALASAENVNAVDKSIREQFAITPESLGAIKDQAHDGRPSDSWVTWVRTFEGILTRRPMLDRQTWQRAVQEGSHEMIRLIVRGKPQPPVHRGAVINAEDKETFPEVARRIARDAGFSGVLSDLVASRLTINPRPTFQFDATLTAQDQTAAAEAVQPVVSKSPVGQIIFQRGDVLTPAQSSLYEAELDAYASTAGYTERLLRTSGIVASAGAITLALAGYTALFCPRIKRSTGRIAGMALLLAGGFVVACVASAIAPQLSSLTAIAPTLLVAVLTAIAYDRRAALAFALLHAMLVCVGLRESIGQLAVVITGIACVVWTLGEIRARNTLLRSSAITALGLVTSTMIFALVERPLAPGISLRVMTESGMDAGLAGVGALVVGGATLFLLPLIERAFGVTTGLTLIDLRDPKQPLLRELQHRAPGTYTHSLNVASIAEGAAEAIGADSLLTYVGALYHDIGKMNKPDYFVENQSGGPNKHDRLSPAMSLLIVVGHVKDGVELAREFDLPLRVQHFIEAHHGTTLVEYFYHRARKQALATAPRDKDGNPVEDDTYVPDECEYRYPGPRPRTKEVAIVMIADAVESASRAMPDPTPSRLDALVRSIANKRLLDGQFDDCELTLRELSLIVESVCRTVTSMHHARIQYPGDQPPGGTPEATPAEGAEARAYNKP